MIDSNTRTWLPGAIAANRTKGGCSFPLKKIHSPKSLSPVIKMRSVSFALSMTASSPGSPEKTSGTQTTSWPASRRKVQTDDETQLSTRNRIYQPTEVCGIASMSSCDTSCQAYTRQARISSASRNGYSCRTYSGVAPSASIARTCSTATRVSRIVGFPANVALLDRIRVVKRSVSIVSE